MVTLAHEHLERIFCSTDLIECGREIVNFAQQASISDERAALIKQYYRTLIQIARADAEPCRHSKIFEGNKAIMRYLLLHSPARQTDIKALEVLKSFGDSLSQDFYIPQGTVLKKQQILELLTYLEAEFCFSKKVFDLWTPYFSILGQCHAHEQACWRKLQSPNGDAIYLFFCSGLQDDGAAAEILFRQMAGILFYRCSYEPGALTAMIKEALEDWYYPGLSLLSKEQRLMVISNGLSLGLLAGSPFEPKKDSLPGVSARRQALHQMVRQIFNKL